MELGTNPDSPMSTSNPSFRSGDKLQMTHPPKNAEFTWELGGGDSSSFSQQFISSNSQSYMICSLKTGNQMVLRTLPVMWPSPSHHNLSWFRAVTPPRNGDCALTTTSQCLPALPGSATTNLLSASVDLSILNISYRWNHAYVVLQE